MEDEENVEEITEVSQEPQEDLTESSDKEQPDTEDSLLDKQESNIEEDSDIPKGKEKDYGI